MTAPAIALTGSAAARAHGAGPDGLLPRYRELAERFHRDALDFELCAGYLLQAVTPASRPRVQRERRPGGNAPVGGLTADPW